MQFRSYRAFISVATAALFLLSAAMHHVVSAGMAAEAGMATSASHDNDMPCPMSSDCTKDVNMRTMACSAHCATVLGILAEPVIVPVTAITRPLQLPAARPLASLHGPPEPPPPKSHA